MEILFFCSSCKKKVYDFRNLNPEESLKIITENRGSICGIFRKEQVNSVFTNKRYVKWIYNFLLLFGLNLMVLKNVLGQKVAQKVKKKVNVLITEQ